MMRCAVNAAVDLVNEEECRRFLVRRFHPAGAHCPHCGVVLPTAAADRFAEGGRLHCRDCGRWFTWTTGTVIEDSKLDVRQLVLLILLTFCHASAESIALATRLTPQSVRSWRRRLAEACQ